MIDQFSFFAGSVSGVVGCVVGQFLGRRGRRPARAPDPRVCGCGHHLATHDLENRECLEDVLRAHYLPQGTRNGHEWVQCECRRYTGEVPLDLSQFDLPGAPGWGSPDPKEKP
jgi:hypothetical protein